MTRLPDDIEQRLLDGQPLRATRALMERRFITLQQAQNQIRVRMIEMLWIHEPKEESRYR